MDEMFRVLRPGGWAYVPVPYQEGPTDEDLSVTDPLERLARFRQEDHVRLYGFCDYLARLSESGFEPSVMPRAEIVTDEETEEMGLTDQVLFLITRPPETTAT